MRQNGMRQIGMRRLGAGIAAALAVVLLGSAALATQEMPKDPKKDADLPAEIQALPFEIRDGYRTFRKRCTACHDEKRVVSAKKSLFDWQGVIGAMSGKPNANIPVDERHRIFLYLTYLHGINGTPQEKDDYMTFLAKCEDCHGVSLMYKEKKAMKEWPAIIHRMAGKNNARISAEDEAKSYRYVQRMSPELFGID